MGKDDITIGLYGIGGVYNYGCEAIIRGTEIILHEILPGANIKYASLRPIDDKIRLKGCNIEIIPRKIHKFGLLAEHLNELMASRTGFYYERMFREDLNWIDDCDVIFSIGGDLYTLPPNYNDPKKRYTNNLINFGEFVKSRGKKFVVWGASIGPFEGYPKAKKAFLDHLRKADLITSREPVTTRYLKNLGIENVIECSDPAFSIPNPDHIDKQGLNSKKLHIGINLSPLSSIYSIKLNMSDVIKRQADVITSIIKSFDAQITLVPHVICDFYIDDDDLRYLKLIKSQIDADVIDRVDLVEGDVGFLGTKRILSTCDLVIAARMHCAVSAVSVGVPTIFLAYSKKAYGMAEYVYGSDKWVIPLKDFEIQNIKKLMNKIINEDLGSFERLNYPESSFYKIVKSTII